ncbi:MAG TPA: hypothetical protein VNV41_08920 [Candidatus Acidoferrales bacterium]|nr:hypothetical protein [Candidatus Acidoferrales bacterium]
MSSRHTNSIRLALSLGLTLFVVALAATASVRVRFTPKFIRGEVLRYRVESRTTTKGTTTTPIVNPEGGSQSTETIHMVVRLDAIGASPGGQVRFRATYEKSSAESESDALDLAASSFADQYDRLEGQSVEFTLQPTGEFTDFQNVGAAAPGRPTAGQPASGQSASEPALALVQGLFLGGDIPQKGVVIGQKWTSERPISGAVLSSLISRAESSYLRNESCGSSAEPKTSGTPSAAPADDCAVILTQFEILRRGSTNSDATPDDYRRNGLRTSGTWTGSGESLDSISLATGLLVSSTRTSTQNMDYQITSASTGSSIHHVGKVQSQSEITLLSGPP